MHTIRKRSGSAYTLVIVVFIFVSMYSVLMLSGISQAAFENQAYALQMQCYYLNNQAAKATVAVLLDDDNELLNNAGFYPRTDILVHKDEEGNEIGKSVISLTREYLDYYGEDSLWAVAQITTTIPDPRAVRAGQDFDYQGTAMVLLENPLIQLFNINPEDFR